MASEHLPSKLIHKRPIFLYPNHCSETSRNGANLVFPLIPWIRQSPTRCVILTSDEGFAPGLLLNLPPRPPRQSTSGLPIMALLVPSVISAYPLYYLPFEVRASYLPYQTGMLV